MNSVVLLGAGGHLRSVIDVIETLADLQIIGISGTEEEKGRRILNKYAVSLTDSELPSVFDDCQNAHVTHADNLKLRKRLAEVSAGFGFNLLTIASPRAQISNHAKVSAGCFVAHNVVVNAAAKVGRNTVLNTSSVVEHDAAVGEHSHIGPGALILGGAKVGSLTFIGAGASVLPGVSVGDNCTVGAGAVVTKDVPHNVIVAGVPARALG